MKSGPSCAWPLKICADTVMDFSTWRVQPDEVRTAIIHALQACDRHRAGLSGARGVCTARSRSSDADDFLHISKKHCPSRE